MLKKISLIILLFISSINVRASHVAGGEISYECQGNGHYKFTLILYRDCFGINAPSYVTMNLENSCGFPSDTLQLFLSSIPPVDINPNCSFTSTCHGGTFPGIQKLIYEGTFVFPVACNWSFNVEIQARNEAITTIANASQKDLFLFGQIYYLNNLCDTSPIFNKEPDMFTCVNQPTCFDMSAGDLDNDSIVYSLIQPMISSGQGVPYMAPYSITQPILVVQPFNLNSKTGIVCFTPTQSDVGVYAVLVSSYRNGLLIGQVERDLEIDVLNCNGSAPDISGFNGSNDTSATVCAYYPTCFNVYTGGQTMNDSTRIYWTQNITDASFSILSGQNETGHFCWTPGQQDISSTPHCFTVYTKDNSCFANLSNSKTFCFTVIDTLSGCSFINTGEVILDEYNLKIFPQPAIDWINFDFGVQNSSIYYLCIDDMLSRRLYRDRITGNQMTINCHDVLSGGIYIAFIEDENGRVHKKTKFTVVKY